MPNNVENKLVIHCEDEKILNKIKLMIFDEIEKNERIFTMEKMLPIPEICSGKDGYVNYGYNWCLAVWGTKWDVYNYNISEGGNTISIITKLLGIPMNNG